MRKTLLLIPFLVIILAVPLACAGSFNMKVSGSGNIGFINFSSDKQGTIIQGYTGDGEVKYESSYSEGTLNSKIDSKGYGVYGTFLNSEDTWSADADYEDDGSSVSDFGSGSNTQLYLHTWSKSFYGGGYYSLD